jgi:hypothetical protein
LQQIGLLDAQPDVQVRPAHLSFWPTWARDCCRERISRRFRERLFVFNSVADFISLDLIPSRDHIDGRVCFHATRKCDRRNAGYGDCRLAKVMTRIDDNLSIFTERPPNDLVSRELKLFQEILYDSPKLSLLGDEVYERFIRILLNAICLLRGVGFLSFRFELVFFPSLEAAFHFHRGRASAGELQRGVGFIF